MFLLEEILAVRETRSPILHHKLLSLYLCIRSPMSLLHSLQIIMNVN